MAIQRIINVTAHIRRLYGQRFLFQHALLIALGFHVVAAIAYVVSAKPEVVEVPFNQIYVRLGDVDFAAQIRQMRHEKAPAPEVVEIEPEPPAPEPAPVPEPPAPEPVAKPAEAQTFEDIPDIVAVAAKTAPRAVPRSLLYQRRPARQKYVAPKPAQKVVQKAQLAVKSGKVGSKHGNRKFRGDNPKLNYTQLLSLWLEKHKEYPKVAIVRQMVGEGVVRIDVEKSGYITRYKLEKKTGHPVLDDAILKMIEAANPVPPIPDNVSSRAFRIPIRFDIEE